MADEYVTLLNSRSFFGRRTNAKLRAFCEGSPASSGQPNGPQTYFASRQNCIEYIWGIAAGGDADGHVTGARQSLHLPGKDLIKSVVVPDGRNTGTVHRERQCRQSRPVERKASNKFRGDMLRVGSAATVAEQHHLVSLPQ